VSEAGVVGILLAAGAGSRFGGGKLLHSLDGVAIGVRSARNLLAAGLPVLAVVRPGNEALAALLENEGCTVTVCRGAADGMGVSLAHGIAQSGPVANGWVVALADMPRILPETIKRVAAEVGVGALITAPTYRGQRGHPVGFGAKLHEELLKLSGDEGARAVLSRHRAEMRLIECDDPGVVFDIDSRDDLPAV
jgi:molybdenum cofactor cytidylyltransferase